MRGLQPIPLLIPSIDLDRQAIISTGNFDWVEQFMGWTLSARERSLHEEKSSKSCDRLVQLKSSMNAILQSFTATNLNHGQIRVFQLACKHKNDSSDTLIFASALRHNTIQDSILLDAYVVPLTRERVSDVIEALTCLVKSGEILSVAVKSREEGILWKKLLPVQVECCRQTWHHGEDCQYRAQNRIPLSIEHSQLSICSCGESQDIDGFPRFQNWEILAKYATRIAVMPLSAVPYMESFMTKEQRHQISQIFTLPNIETGGEKCDNCGKNSAPPVG